MESIIKHLVEITGHRDHDLLNISVASAVRELMGAHSVRVLELVSTGSQIMLASRVVIGAGSIVRTDESTVPEENIEAFPLLKSAIEAKKSFVLDEANKLLWLPLWINDKLHACIEINQPASCSENVMEVVNGMLIVYRNFQNLLDYSERDSLTGLLNRKTFDDSFSKVLRNPSPSSSSHAGEDRRDTEQNHWLAVLDIDHFKRVNDEFGHLYGDEVLILVANLLRASFRPGDRLFRFGGEEFVILLRSATQQDADIIFDRFRAKVAEHLFPQVGKVTISIGYARIEPFEPAVAIVGRADQALYFAKSHGRNRCCYYDHLVESGDLLSKQVNEVAEFF